MHDASMRLMNRFIETYLKDMKGSSVIDVGSRLARTGLQETYRGMFEPDFKYEGMDLQPGENVDIVGYESLKGRVFDVLISGQTMEHLNHPWDWLKSLKPYFSKYICIIAPWKANEHNHPIDTYRYLPAGMKDLFNYAEINIVEVVKGKKDTMAIGSK